MDGANAGEVASALAISSVKAYLGKLPDGWSSSPDIIPNALVGAIKYAHRKILKHGRNHPELSGMGTTIVLVYLNDGNMHVAWAGDSRLYLYRQGQLELISHDHSLVQELIDEAKITYQESLYHPERHIVTKCLGSYSEGTVDPGIRSEKLMDGDRILRCSDGLNGMLVDARIEEIMAAHADLSKCAAALIDEANAAGGDDNITVVVGEVLLGNL